MSNNVQVVRYIRKFVWTSDGGYVPGNMHGITLVYDMDYEEGKVYVSWSVAVDTNFEKSVGVSRARFNNQRVVFSMCDVDTHGSLGDAFYWEHLHNLVRNDASYFYGDEFDTWRVALNKLNQPLAEKRKAARKKMFQEALFGSEND